MVFIFIWRDVTNTANFKWVCINIRLSNSVLRNWLFWQMVRHGGCLGLGLAAMGTHRQDVYDQLKFNLYQDDAVTGEAAGIAMGMVMLGSEATQAIEDMVAVSG